VEKHDGRRVDFVTSKQRVRPVGYPYNPRALWVLVWEVHDGEYAEDPGV